MKNSCHKILLRRSVAVRIVPGADDFHFQAHALRLSTLVFAMQAVFASGAWAQTPPSLQAVHGSATVIDAAQKGPAIVQIAAPSAAGVSHNRYQHFNVTPAGVILNNSAHATQTALGGGVAANPHLGNQPARVILNEVTSGSQSSLRGIVEVAGHRADVIVANPNGIQCDGCGFLNVGRATLTTGVPRIDANGHVSGFEVSRGNLTVERGGLDARNLHQLDLFARGIEIHGEVFAERIYAIAGANQVSYGESSELKGAAEPNGAPPTFAIDISQFGGMHARQIYLMATERGLGVNSVGRLQADVGALALSADGDLRIGSAYGGQGVTLHSTQGDVEVSGSVVSPSEVHVTTTKLLRNTGNVSAGRWLRAYAREIHNGGSLVSGEHSMPDPIGGFVPASATGGSEGFVELKARLKNEANGTVFSSGNLKLEGSLHNRGGLVQALADIDVTGEVFNENANLNLRTEALKKPVREISYSRDSEPDVEFREEAVRVDSAQNLVLPSKRFAFDQYGHEPYDIEALLSPKPMGSATKPAPASTLENVWELFGLSPADLSGVGDQQTRRTLALEKLKPKLDEFNSDLAGRRSDGYFIRTTHQHEIRQDRVVQSQPGRITAGGDIRLAGGLNEDSLITARGSFLSSAGFENRSTASKKTVTAHADVRHVIGAGTGSSGKVARQSKAQTVSSIVSTERIATEIGTAADTPLEGQSTRKSVVSNVAASEIQVVSLTEPFINSGSLIAHVSKRGGKSSSVGEIRVDAESIIHDGDMESDRTTLNAGKGLVINGGKIRGKHTLNGVGSVVNLTAGGNIELRTAMKNFVQSRSGDSGKSALAADQPVVDAGEVKFKAGLDFISEGAAVKAGESATVEAARNIQISPFMEFRSTESDGHGASFSETNPYWRESHIAAKPSRFEAGSSVKLNAGQELKFAGSQASSKDLQLQGREVRITGVNVRHVVEGRSVGDSAVHSVDASRDDVVASLLGARDSAVLKAEADLEVAGSEVRVPVGMGKFNANEDVRISAAVTQRRATASTQSTDAYWLSRGVGESVKTVVAHEVRASRLEGNELQIAAERDVSVSASHTKSINGTGIHAGRHITLGSGQLTSVATKDDHTDRLNGLFSFWGFSGLTGMVGGKNTGRSAESNLRLVEPTSVTSIEGDIAASAGGRYRQAGAGISAKKAVDIRAEVIELPAVSGEKHQIEGSELSQIGLTARMSTKGATGSLMDIGSHYSFGSMTANTQAQVLYAAAGMRSAYAAYTQLPAARNNTMAVVSGISGLTNGEVAPLLRAVGPSFGAEWNRFNGISKDETISQIQVSSVHAGGKIHLQTHSKGGNISTEGASLAGAQVELSAGLIELGAAQSHSEFKENSDYAGLGAAHEVGGQAYASGFGYYGYGGSAAIGQSYVPTKVTANSDAVISSASDVSFKGASVESESVRIQAGGSIHIETLQENSEGGAKRYDLDGYASLGVAWMAGGSGTAGIGSQHYATTKLQSGVRAGDGGFSIQAGGVVSLVGGVLESSASQERNLLAANQLEGRNISNVAGYGSVYLGRGLGYDGSSAPSVTEYPVIPRIDADNAGKVTRSTIAPAVLTFTDGREMGPQDYQGLRMARSEAVPSMHLAQPPAVSSVLRQQQQLTYAVNTFNPAGVLAELEGYIETRNAEVRQDTQNPDWRYGDWLRRAGRDVVDALTGQWWTGQW